MPTMVSVETCAAPSGKERWFQLYTNVQGNRPLPAKGEKE